MLPNLLLLLQPCSAISQWLHSVMGDIFILASVHSINLKQDVSVIILDVFYFSSFLSVSFSHMLYISFCWPSLSSDRSLPILAQVFCCARISNVSLSDVVLSWFGCSYLDPLPESSLLFLHCFLCFCDSGTQRAPCHLLSFASCHCFGV